MKGHKQQGTRISGMYVQKYMRVLLVSVMALFVSGVAILLFLGHNYEDGGTYVNSLYGFRLEFPESWQNKYVIEETFDRIYVRHFEIAQTYGEDEGTLFEILLLGEGEEPPEGSVYLNKTDAVELAWIKGETDSVCYGAGLSADYKTMQANMESWLSENERFSVFVPDTENLLLKAYNHETCEKMLEYRDALKDGSALLEVARLMPFASSYLEGRWEEQPATSMLRLVYDVKDVHGYSYLTLGDVTRSMARVMFVLDKELDCVVIDLGADFLTGYTRENCVGSMEGELTAQDLVSLLTAAPQAGRTWDFGPIDKDACFLRDVPVCSLPAMNSEVVAQADAMSFARVVGAAGDYYYVVWNYTENAPIYGYVQKQTLSFDYSLFTDGKYAYCTDAVRYGLDGESVTNDNWRGWFEIHRRIGGMIEATDAYGERFILKDDGSVTYASPPIGINVTLDVLVNALTEALIVCYEVDFVQGTKYEHIVVEKSALEELPEVYRENMLLKLSDKFGSQVIAASKGDLIRAGAIEEQDGLFEFKDGVLLSIDWTASAILSDYALFSLVRYCGDSDVIWTEAVFASDGSKYTCESTKIEKFT